jgi:hypothetical protein
MSKSNPHDRTAAQELDAELAAQAADHAPAPRSRMVPLSVAVAEALASLCVSHDGPGLSDCGESSEVTEISQGGQVRKA